MNRGCTQGDIDSPIIFNLIIDAVLRTWKQQQHFKESQSCFYADDGLLENTDPKQLQQDLDHIIELFSRVGLKANETKTKYMVIRGAAAPKAMTKQQYHQHLQRYKRRTRTNLSDERQCEACPAGHYCTAGRASACPLGHYCVLGTSAPVACPSGVLGDMLRLRSAAGEAHARHAWALAGLQLARASPTRAFTTLTSPFSHAQCSGRLPAPFSTS